MIAIEIPELHEPMITPLNGIYSSDVTVTIEFPDYPPYSDNPAGTEIVYTENSSLPKAEWMLYTGPFILDHSARIAAAAKYGDQYSLTALISDITIEQPSPPNEITFEPDGGEHNYSVDVTINCTASDAKIYYTLNGDTPDNTSAVYTGPITICQNATLKTAAYYKGEKISEKSEDFTVVDPNSEWQINNGSFYASGSGDNLAFPEYPYFIDADANITKSGIEWFGSWDDYCFCDSWDPLLVITSPKALSIGGEYWYWDDFTQMEMVGYEDQWFGYANHEDITKVPDIKLWSCFYWSMEDFYGMSAGTTFADVSFAAEYINTDPNSNNTAYGYQISPLSAEHYIGSAGYFLEVQLHLNESLIYNSFIGLSEILNGSHLIPFVSSYGDKLTVYAMMHSHNEMNERNIINGFSLSLNRTNNNPTGKLRFFVEQNDQSGYQAGDLLVTNADVYFNDRNNPISVKTNNRGEIFFDMDMYKQYMFNLDRKVFVRKKVYSHPRVKDSMTSVVDSMFDLYMDTDSINNEGEIESRTLTDAELQTLFVDKGTVDIELTHPVFSWNLSIATDFEMSGEYKEQLEYGLKNASKYLFDVTDGHMKLGKYEIIDSARNVEDMESHESWQFADICITKDLARAQTIVALNENNYDLDNGVEYSGDQFHVYMPQYVTTLDGHTFLPDEYGFYRTVVHELGHYLFGFADEYVDGYNNERDFAVYRTEHRSDIPSNYGFMDNQFHSSEMSSYNDYKNTYFYQNMIDEDGIELAMCAINAQIWLHDLNNSSNRFHKPCWQQFYEKFDTQGMIDAGNIKWNNYNDIKVKISLPPDTANPDKYYYRGTPIGDRNRFDILKEPYQLIDEGIVISVRGSATEPLGLIQLNQENTGAGPKYIVDADISQQAGDNILTIQLITDEILTANPQVQVNLYDTSPQMLTMSNISQGVYECTINIGSELEGIIETSAENIQGQTTASGKFLIQQKSQDYIRTIHTPSFSVDAHIKPSAIAGQAISWVTLESDVQSPEHNDPNKIFVTSPVTIKHQENAVIGSDYTINWFIPASSLAGCDLNTIILCRFNKTTGQWDTQSSGYSESRGVVSAGDIPAGIYAVFAESSLDTITPAAISDLNATSVIDGGGIELNWTATGDDGMSGTAVSYSLFYNKQLIDVNDLRQCQVITLSINPSQSGQSEQYVLDSLEDTDTYYFAIKAKDEAGNYSDLSNIASAAPGIFDNDSDGMPNDFELTYGFDPNDPNDAAIDSDNDNLTNLEEYIHKTLPNTFDTDTDGMPDGWEVQHGFDPVIDDGQNNLDRDNDLLINYDEYLNNTDPDDSDTDSDGILDGIDNCKLVPNYDQLDIDTDGKGNACDCLADLTNNNIVDIEDLFLFTQHWLEASCSYPDYCQAADFDMSSSVNLADFTIFAENWLTEMN